MDTGCPVRKVERGGRIQATYSIMYLSEYHTHVMNKYSKALMSNKIIVSIFRVKN